MPGKPSSASLLEALNDRQRVYLRELAREDLSQELMARAAPTDDQERIRKASDWRAIKYGPQLSPSIYQDPPLRARLREHGLVSPGTGQTWAKLEALGLVRAATRTEELIGLKGVARIDVLHLTLTRQGRRIGRSLLPKGELPKKTTQGELSSSAWRLLLYAGAGHTHTVTAWSITGGDLPKTVVLAAVVKGLQNRGLIEPSHWSLVKITEAGRAFVSANASRYFERYPYSKRWSELYEAKIK